MAEAGSGDPFSGKTDAFLRSARSSKTSRGAIDSIMADHGRSGTSFWGSIGSFFSSEVLPRVGGVVQAGWGLLQMNLGFGLIVGSGFAEGLSGGTLTPLAIVGALGGGMLALHGSGDLWAGMQTAWDGKPHENMANTLARDVAKSLGANDPDWWANSFDAASVGLAWVAPAVQPRPEFPKLYPESPGPKPVKPPWEAPKRNKRGHQRGNRVGPCWRALSATSPIMGPISDRGTRRSMPKGPPTSSATPKLADCPQRLTPTA